MSNVQKNEPKNTRLILMPVLLIVSFCLFFLFAFGSLLTDSQKQQVNDFFTRYISGDLMIHHTKSKSPVSFLISEVTLPSKALLPLDDYAKIENYLKKNENISAFTPYSFYPARIMNPNKGTIPILLKIIKIPSFIKEFPQIRLTPSGGTTLHNADGLFLPSDLITVIGKLYKTDIRVENSLLIADENASLYSVRETHFSGTVTYENYPSLFSSVAYIDADSFPLSIDSHEPEKRDESDTSLPFPGAEAFYSTFITSEPRIKKETLPDSYFFEFFVNKRESETRENPSAPEWQYIAVSAGKKSTIPGLKNELKRQFYEEDIPVTISTRDEIADPVQKTIFMNRIFLYILSAILILLLFVLFTLTVRTHARRIYQDTDNGDNKKNSSSFQKILIAMNIKTIIISGAGICAGILLIPALNAADISIGSDLLSMLFAGGSILFITISIPPILMSILILMICIGIINIYPLFLLHRMHHQHQNT
ncbi:MAG: hypothetical protein JXJ04_24195 [Spirochaetales bacterium]|nr:hypothetical protein [Spirochaetales bacterium]